jgi:hypothetical protein
MDNTNFWLRNPPIAYAVVNGLIGSMCLWAFWTPFITFLAQPFASAMMKTAICSTVNAFPSLPILPGSSKTAATAMLTNDPDELKDLNKGAIISIWLVAALSIVMSAWIVTSIIHQGNLDVNHIIKLNAAMFIVIVSVEMIFFVELGLRFIPFNIQAVFDGVVGNITQEIKQYQ